LAICRPSGCNVASGVVVVGVCNSSQMRTSKYTCLIFGVSIGLHLAYKCTKGIFDRSKFEVTRDISPTISGWLLVAKNGNMSNGSCRKNRLTGCFLLAVGVDGTFQQVSSTCCCMVWADFYSCNRWIFSPI